FRRRQSKHLVDRHRERLRRRCWRSAAFGTISPVCAGNATLRKGFEPRVSLALVAARPQGERAAPPRADRALGLWSFARLTALPGGAADLPRPAQRPPPPCLPTQRRSALP